MEYVTKDSYAGEGIYTVGEEQYILVEPPHYQKVPIDGKHPSSVFYGRAIGIGNPIYGEEAAGNANAHAMVWGLAAALIGKDPSPAPGSTKAFALVWNILHEEEAQPERACDMAHPVAAIPLGGTNYFFNIHTERFYPNLNEHGGN